ncbi:MAG: hypothetical protein ACXWTN_07675 [Methylosarcina sp.]
MTLKNRATKLEGKFNIVHEAMPEGLSPKDQYLWLINDTRPVPQKETPVRHLTPEEAYAALNASCE